MAATEKTDAPHVILEDWINNLEWLKRHGGVATATFAIILFLIAISWWYWPSIIIRPGVKYLTAVLRRGRAISAGKSAFLVISSMAEEWQTDLNRAILEEAQNNGICCTIFVLDRPHDLNDRLALFRRLTKSDQNFSLGIVVIPGWPVDREGELIELAKEFDKPIVCVDHNTSLSPASIPRNAAFVSVSDREGGELAARAVSELPNSRELKRILVIKGFAKPDRELTFKSKIEAVLACEVIIGPSGNFDRQMTRKVVGKRLKEAIDSHKPFDLVFCTSDAMTLGCLDAIWRLAADQTYPLPKVIGYDGVPSTKALIDDEDRYLARVVVQDTRRLANLCIDQLLQIEKGANNEKIFTTRPSLYPETLRIDIKRLIFLSKRGESKP